MPEPTMTAERPSQQAISAPKVERVRPVIQPESRGKSKGGQEAVRQFGQIVEEAITDQNKRPEALAAIAGWTIFGKINLHLSEMQHRIIGLTQNNRLTKEKSEGLMEKVSVLSKKVHESILPVFGNLDKIVRQENPDKIDPFLRDLNYHYLHSEIKALESAGANAENGELIQLKEDLQKATKSREGLNPEDDEVIKFAKLVRGEKELPKKFKDSPLEAVDDFFNHNLKQIKSNEHARNQLAQRLGISSDELVNLVTIFEIGQEQENAFNEVDKLITTSDSEYVPTSKKWLKKGGIFSGLLAGLLLMQTYMAAKKESGEGGQGRG